MATFSRYLTNINFGVEVGGKGMAVITAVDIDDIQFINLIEVVFGMLNPLVVNQEVKLLSFQRYKKP